MTQNEIRVLVERGLHTEGYRRYGNLDPAIMDLYLNKSMNEYLDSILSYLRGVGFEDSTVNITDTETLKGSHPLVKISPRTFASGESYTIAAASGDTYRNWIKFTVSVTSSYLTAPTYFKARIYDSEFTEDLLQDTYHATYYRSPVAVIEGSEIKVYTNSDFTLGNGSLLYLKKPTVFNVVTSANSQYPLPDRIVNEVIDKTIEAMKRDKVMIATNVNAK